VEGTCEIVGLDDSLPGFEPSRLAALIRAIFVAAGGTHDDWAEFDRAMADEDGPPSSCIPSGCTRTPAPPRSSCGYGLWVSSMTLPSGPGSGPIGPGLGFRIMEHLDAGGQRPPVRLVEVVHAEGHLGTGGRLPVFGLVEAKWMKAPSVHDVAA